MYDHNHESDSTRPRPYHPLAVGIFITFLVGTALLVLMIGLPKYSVWRAGQTGQAEYRRAEQNRRIRTLEAEAKRESAILEASAEIERAKGVSTANEIVADGLNGREEYLRYLWITNLQAGDNREVIYIPTEAGLPILEAGKR